MKSVIFLALLGVGMAAAMGACPSSDHVRCSYINNKVKVNHGSFSGEFSCSYNAGKCSCKCGNLDTPQHHSNPASAIKPGMLDFSASKDYTFYFGTQMPSSGRGTKILDAGLGFKEHANGFSYGWSCNGNKNVNYHSGRRGLNRGRGLGLNHFDRNNQCKSGSTYLGVEWSVSVPNGHYIAEVVFPEYYKSHCSVQRTNAGCPGNNNNCKVNREVLVDNEIFEIGGFGHDSRKCHSIAMVSLRQK